MGRKKSLKIPKG